MDLQASVIEIAAACLTCTGTINGSVKPFSHSRRRRRRPAGGLASLVGCSAAASSCSAVCFHGKGSSDEEKEAEEAYDYVPSGGVVPRPVPSQRRRTQVNVSSVVDLDLALRGRLPQSLVQAKSELPRRC